MALAGLGLPVAARRLRRRGQRRERTPAARAAAPAATVVAADAPPHAGTVCGPPPEEALRSLRDLPPPDPSPPVLRGGGLLEVPTPGEMICKACGRMIRWKTRMEHLRGKDHWEALAEAHQAAAEFRASGGRWAAVDDAEVAGATSFDLGGADYDFGTFTGMNGTWVDTVSSAGGDDLSIVGPRWHMTELKAPSWPKRRNGNGICLDPTWTLDKVTRTQRLRIWRYLSAVLTPDRTLRDPFGPSLPEIFAEADWSLVRVKELFESCEMARITARQLLAAERLRPITHIYDLACGHGLVGILLAYCFPEKQVLCFDLQKRRSFAAVVDGWLASERCARAAASGPAPLSNIEFIEGDAYEELPTRLAESPAPEGALVVAVHACNEATPQAIALAEERGMCWAVMPCCFDESLYLPLTPVRPRRRRGARAHHGKAGLGDNARYLFVCGALASRHEAWLVREIDARITNRNLVMIGGSAWHEEARGTAEREGDGMPHQGRGSWNPMLAP